MLERLLNLKICSLILAVAGPGLIAIHIRMIGEQHTCIIKIEIETWIAHKEKDIRLLMLIRLLLKGQYARQLSRSMAQTK